MASNRRNQSGAVRLVPALKAVLLCVLIGGSAVGYVLQKKRIHDLAQQLGAKQERLERLRRENQFQAKRLAMLMGHQQLIERVKDMKLDLVPPQRHQIVWLSEPPPATAPYATNALPAQFVQFNPNR